MTGKLIILASSLAFLPGIASAHAGDHSTMGVLEVTLHHLGFWMLLVVALLAGTAILYRLRRRR